MTATSTAPPADELEELIGFLAATGLPAPVLAGALDIVIGLTASPEGLARLKQRLAPLLQALLRALGQKDAALAGKVVGSLVNLSQDPAAAGEMLKMNTVGRCMDYLKEGTCTCSPRLLVMLLSNLSVSEQGSRDVLQLGQGKMEGLHVAVLLKRFVVAGVNWAPGQEDEYEHVANILVNITRFKEGRVLMLQPGRGILQVLVAQLRAPGQLRRQGAAGALRNCCMSAEADGTLEHVVSDPAVLRAMLQPISGQEPKEKDELVRECMAECIMVLSASASGRAALQAVDAYDAVHKGYELEEHPGVCKALEQAGEHFLLTGKGEEEGGGAAEGGSGGEQDPPSS